MKRTLITTLIAAPLALGGVAIARSPYGGEPMGKQRSAGDAGAHDAQAASYGMPSAPRRTANSPSVGHHSDPSGTYSNPSGTATGTTEMTGTTGPRGMSRSGTDGAKGTPGNTTNPKRSGTNGRNVVTTGTNAGAAGSLSPSDMQLVVQFMESSRNEIEHGQIALKMAESARVKAYARKMVRDHQAARKRLTAILTKKGVDPSQLSQRASAQGPATGTAGAGFDRQFVTTMVDEHEKAIGMGRASVNELQDQQLKAFFRQVLPKLEGHRKAAQQLLEKHVRS